MIKDALQYLDFDDLVSVGEDLDSVIDVAKSRSQEQVAELGLEKQSGSLDFEQGRP